MEQPTSRIRVFLSELQRRKVFRVALVYAVVALGVIEAADLTFPALYLPDGAYQLVVILAIAGFPVIVALAWVFELTPEGVQRELPADEAQPVPPPSRRSRVAAAATLALFAALLLVWRPWRSPGGESLAALTGADFLDSVAILPVENRTGDSALLNLSAGLTDEMIGALKRIGRVKVIDPFSVQRFLDLQFTPRQLADSLGVSKLVQASLYRDTGRMWVNVRTTASVTGSAVWTQRYDAEVPEGLAAAGEIARAFGNDYVANTPALTTSVSFDRPTHGTTGQQAYLLGKSWLGRRTKEGLSQARAKFEEAIELEEGHAEAYAALSKAHALSLAYRYRWDLDGYGAAGLALALANRAVELEPEGSSGYSARGYIATRSHAPPEDVDEDCRRAIELAPGAADALSWCARVINQQGEVDAAFDAAAQAIALDPQNAGRRLALAYEALSLGRYERALEEARAARSLQPELMLPRAIEARALLLSGRASECLGLDLGPHDGIRAMCLYELGRSVEATVIADSISRELSSGAVLDSIYSHVIRAEDLACYYAWTRDVDQAVTWMDIAFELSPSGVEPRVLESALFARVRTSPEFRREMERVRSAAWERVKGGSRTALP
jgi:TolB-like protein